MGQQISLARLNTITTRQQCQSWSSVYQPAIRATREEAPRISRPAILISKKIGRYVHVLSRPEANATLLALHHPLLFNIHEQRVLSPTPALHPLSGCPSAAGMSLPPLRGTILVAEELGVISQHPKLFSDQTNSWVPFPYIGDLLLFLRDDTGPYCMNWTIKDSEGDFSRPGPRPFGKPSVRAKSKKAELRHLIEEKYYADANIRTIQVTQTKLNLDLIANLRMLFLSHSRTIDVPEKLRTEIVDIFRGAVDTNIIAFDLVKQVANETMQSFDSVKAILFQAIWNRLFHVELFKPLLIDRPLRSPTNDPFLVYADWFRR